MTRTRTRIPTKFSLLNRTWSVKLLPELEFYLLVSQHRDLEEGDRLKGACLPDFATIVLNADEHGGVDDLLHTFYHELFHAMMFGDGIENHDEAQVDRMGAYLHQIIVSMGGWKDVRQTDVRIAPRKARRGTTEAVQGYGGEADDRSGEEP